jgi:membrane peptidoglycan carboxypeptidase
MPAPEQITRIRQQRRYQARKNPAARLGLGCAGLLSLALALASIFGALAYSSLTRDLPTVEALPALIEPPDGTLLQPTRLYDRRGEHVILEIQNPASAGRQYLRLEPETTAQTRIPETLIQATLAASDPLFWRHAGFSLNGLASGAHPTLAQRLVSDLLLEDEPPSLRRALRERLLAAQLTRRFGREKVLEWFLNSASYGRLAFGADAAARLYFDKTAADLDLAEAALLASVANDPSLNPFDAPQSALERQKYVLQDMLRYRLADPQAAAQAAQQTLAFRPIERPGQALSISDLEPQIAPAFAQMALAQVESYIPRSRLERGGLNILTTLDYDLQQQVRCAMAEQLSRAGSPPRDGTLLEDCPAARLLPTLPMPQPVSGLQANAIVLEPQTGQIRALAGDLPSGPDESFLPAHPAGSLGTPFIYLTSFTRGLGPASLVWDIPAQAGEPEWTNFDGNFRGPIRLRVALANDYLVPAGKLFYQLGKENVWRTVEQLGLTEPASGIDGSDLPFLRPLNLIEASQAFGVFANQGILAGHVLAPAPVGPGGSLAQMETPPPIQPATVLQVEDTTGKVWLDQNTWQTRPIITPELAYLVTHILSDETARWPSLGHPNPLEVGRPAAVKLGRTLDNASNWVIGYTPHQLVGVWLGEPEPSAGQTAQMRSRLPQAAAGLWHAITQYAHQNLPIQSWPVPSGVVEVKVCDPSGMLPTQECPNIVDEVFQAGNEPIQADRLYHNVPVNRESGRLATIYTPPDLVEERPYLVVPPEAIEWARQEGLEAPPNVYDTLPPRSTPMPEAHIFSPQAFAILRGQAVISGTVAIDHLDFFRLQAGQGLNPQAWFQIGEDHTSVVSEGVLETWDTRDLNGLYALQLVVVQEDQSVVRDTVLVTVDNQPPEIKIGSPYPGEEINASERPKVVLWANVSDDLGIARVEFYLDNRLLATFVQPPYGISWESIPGDHQLTVRAVDQAGNTSEATVEFTVQ